ncbi:MAG: hypothetical protein WC525_10320 [Candidatus Thermoplasmatota archaeon]
MIKTANDRNGRDHTGFIELLYETSIKVGGKTLFIPPEKREKIKNEEYTKGEKVKVTYSVMGVTKSHLIDIERIPLTDEEKLHIQEQQEKDHVAQPQQPQGTSAASAAKLINMHMHVDSSPEPATSSDPELETSLQLQQHVWMPDTDKNEYILIQSVLARAVEIINAHYAAYPDILKGEKTLGDTPLDARCNLVEKVADRLYNYAKKKVHDGKTKTAPKKQGSGNGKDPIG